MGYTRWRELQPRDVVDEVSESEESVKRKGKKEPGEDAKPVADGDGATFAPGLTAAVKPAVNEDPEAIEKDDRVAPQSGPEVQGAGKKAKGKPKAKPETSTAAKSETDEERAKRLRREHENKLAAARMRGMRARRKTEEEAGATRSRSPQAREARSGKSGELDWVGIAGLLLAATAVVGVLYLARKPILGLFGWELVDTPVAPATPALPSLERPAGI